MWTSTLKLKLIVSVLTGKLAKYFPTELHVHVREEDKQTHINKTAFKECVRYISFAGMEIFMRA